MTYDEEIDYVYEKMIHDNKDMNYIKENLINLFKELIYNGSLKELFQLSEIPMMETWLNEASSEIHDKNDLERLIDSRCQLWKYHDKCTGDKKQLLRVLLYAMYAYYLEGYDDELYELIASIIEGLADIDEKFADKFIEGLINDEL